ncbi:MAG: hypothetical protein J5626_10875 [Lachnospiraceae bacterium]|nr:hypothetical protein [Lachnospiraceae bacterium]
MEKAFVVGAVNAFLTGEERLYAIEGKATGFVTPGESLLLTDPGSDTDRVHRVTVTKVCVRKGKELEPVSKAGECNLVVYFECDKEVKLRNGIVLHSESATDKEVRKAYLNVLGNVFVVARDLDLNEKDFGSMELTDLVEIWRCFWQYAANRHHNEKETGKYKERLERLMDAVCEKTFELDGLNIVYSKRTNEPFMFNNVIKHGKGGAYCTFPDIIVVTDADKERVMEKYDPEFFEIRHVSKDNMIPFLGGCFYINGAAGVRFNDTDARLAAETMVERPADEGEEYGNLSNPDLERWLLLLSQLPDSERNEGSVAFGLFAREMEKEIVKAKFLIPAQPEGEGFRIAVQEGKGEKQAARLYTDWGKLRIAYDPTWAAIIQTLEEILDKYDAIINVTGETTRAIYFTKEDYERIKH